MSITQLDFGLSSIAAILTVIGYSVNDSVVIYDRIRENIRKYSQKTIPEIINISINETLSRTTLTVLTTLIANLALIIYGGEAIRSFSVLVFFGIVAGTYSSIFISAPVLTLLKLEKFK
jgi:preprotein translocase subunit SecF